MIVTPYHLERFGFTLEAAAIDIEELTSRSDPSFENPKNPAMPVDGYVRIRIWVNKEAYDTGKDPIHTEEGAIALDYAQRQAYHTSVLQGFLGIES